MVDQYPDLAITDYARIGRGLMLFQDGQRSQVPPGRRDPAAAVKPSHLEVSPYSSTVANFLDGSVVVLDSHVWIHCLLIINGIQAILELEDLDFSFKGSAELSAAITAALYSERPGLLQRAEAEWRIVDSFDRRYYDPKWVRHSLCSHSQRLAMASCTCTGSRNIPLTSACGLLVLCPGRV